MADRGSTSGKLPTSTISTRKRMKQGSDTKRQSEGSPELVLEIKLTVGWDFRDVALCCFLQSGGRLTRYPTVRHICFQKFILALQFIYSTFFHQEADLTAI